MHSVFLVNLNVKCLCSRSWTMGSQHELKEKRTSKLGEKGKCRGTNTGLSPSRPQCVSWVGCRFILTYLNPNRDTLTPKTLEVDLRTGWLNLAVNEYLLSAPPLPSAMIVHPFWGVETQPWNGARPQSLDDCWSIKV